MDKKAKIIPSYEEFKNRLSFADPIDQELFILTMNSNFQKAIQAFKTKHRIQSSPFPAPTDRSFYPLSIHDLFNYSNMNDEESLKKDFIKIVQKTRFSNTRYSINFRNGIIYFILYGKPRKTERNYGDSSLPPVKIAVKKYGKSSDKENIRITLDIFQDTTEDEVRMVIHETWGWIIKLRAKLRGFRKVRKPSIKDTLPRDVGLFYLINMKGDLEEFIKSLPENLKLTEKEAYNRSLKMRQRIKESFTS